MRMLPGILVILSTLLHTDWCLVITSPSSSLIKEQGTDDVTLNCIIEGRGVDFFFTTPMWSKVLPDREVQINTGANIGEPFSKTGRYSILMQNMNDKEPPEIHLSLIIKDISVADNGTYRCAIKQEGNIISTVEHYLVVPAPIDSLELVTNKTTITDLDKPVYHFVQLEPSYISCRSQGGNPEPQVRIYYGKTDITGEFHTEVKETRTGEMGLEVVHYDVQVVSSDFRAMIEHSGKNLKCVSRIHKLPQLKKTVSGVMDVKYPPLISGCHEHSYAFIGTQDHIFLCHIRANPPVAASDVYWIIGDDHNTTNLTMGETRDGYSANYTVNEKDGSLNITLTFDEVKEGSFQKYVLRAVNELSDVHYPIHLHEGAKSTTTTTKAPKYNPSGNSKNNNIIDFREEHGKPAAASDSGNEANQLYHNHYITSCLLPLLMYILC